MKADTSVKFITSTMVGATALTGAEGSLLNSLRPCLCSGFGTVSVTSISITNNTATVTTATEHKFSMYGTTNTGPVITLSGVTTPSVLNGEWRINSVPSTTTFTFKMDVIADQSATGTIFVKRSGAGWTEPFTPTSTISVFRPQDPMSTLPYLRIEDVGTGVARLTGYETMTGLSVGDNSFPTAAQQAGGTYSIKTGTEWRFYGDGCTFWFAIKNGTWCTFSFGDIISFAVSDAYSGHIQGQSSTGTDYLVTLNHTGSTINQLWVARSSTAAIGAIPVQKYTLGVFGSASGMPVTGDLPYPNGVNGKFYASPCVLREYASGNIRGVYPGMYYPLHSNIADGTFISNIEQLNGGTVIIQTVGGNTNYKACFDLTGPWR